MLPVTHHGTWTGQSRLWLDPDAEPERSDATAEVGADTLAYDWSQGGRPQHGHYGLAVEGELVLATFTDSFHTDGRAMACMGASVDDRISVTGKYAAPTGGDWGWRTEIDPTTPDSLALRMFNISPDGTEALAVEMLLHR